MEDVTKDHEEKETLLVDVILPGHEQRVTTTLFSHTRDLLLKMDGGRCFVCERTAEEAGEPLEAHHWLIERALANAADWQEFVRFVGLLYRLTARAHDFVLTHPLGPPDGDIMAFVDDMTVNGMLLCKLHHTGKDSGIHDLPEPLWAVQAYGRDGYTFSSVETLAHDHVPIDLNQMAPPASA